MDDLLLKGICDGSRAFQGPEIVQFDITNRCNNNCLCCWNNSPFLGESTDWKKQDSGYELPKDLIIKTIGELGTMGTKVLFFAGGGEPFMHPDIVEILRYAKKQGMRVFMNSNFSLIDEEIARELVDSRIDHIHVSLHAGTPETYASVHPNKTKETFSRIKNILRYIAERKKIKDQHLYTPFPHINLYQVIFNRNWRDIIHMVDLAIEVKADSIEFTPVDVIPGKTDCLLLDNEQVRRVSDDVRSQLQRLEKYNLNEPVKCYISQYQSFLKRINSRGALDGRYESDTVANQPCYVGWFFLRILANGNVVPCLKAHKISVGNLYQSPIGEIWNSQGQRTFREKTFALKGNDQYFSMIGNNPGSQFGCLNSCDNLQINVDLHKRYADVLKKNGRI